MSNLDRIAANRVLETAVVTAAEQGEWLEQRCSSNPAQAIGDFILDKINYVTRVPDPLTETYVPVPPSTRFGSEELSAMEEDDRGPYAR